MIDIVKPWLDMLPTVLGAVVIIIVGFFIASIMKGLTRSLFSKLNLDEHIGKISGSSNNQPPKVTEFVSNIVYYLVLLFVLMALLELFHLTMLVDPIRLLLGGIFVYATRFLGAVVLILVAWLVAKMLRMATYGLLNSLQIDQKLADRIPNISLAKSLSEIVFGLTFLFFMPAILDALALQGLLTPVNAMVTKLLAFLPNLLGAAVLVIIAWLLACFLRSLSYSLLRASGLDDKISSYTKQLSVAKTISEVLYALIWLLFLPAVLEALALQGLLSPVNAMIGKILDFLPNLFAACILLVVSYICGHILAQIVSGLLSGFGVDAFLEKQGLVSASPREYKPSLIIGKLVIFWVMLLAIMETAHVLGFALLAELSAKFTVFAAQILLGVIIFAIGIYLANWSHRVISGGGMAKAALLANCARVAILVLSAAMALREMGIANDIINLAFGLLLGAVAVAIALAFGLGGRQVAQRHLAEWSDCIKDKEKYL